MTGEDAVVPLLSTGEWLSHTGEVLQEGLSAGAFDALTPELMVNVQNVGSWLNVSGFLGEYFPSLSVYSDIELLSLGMILFLWILCVIWVLRDAMARSNSVFYQFFSCLLVVFLTPILGLPLYLAFRPLVYRWDRGFWREALEQDIVWCPHCQGLNSPAHMMCVRCGEPIQAECKECHSHFQSSFSYCPDCWAPHLE